MFAPFVKQGKEIPSRWVRAWVDERIAPPSRQNIGEVLRANGLVTYDPVTLLAVGEGRSTQDGFYLREVGDGVRGGRELGIHLAAARERAGMTQEELARRSGVSQDNISLFERGGGNPTVRTLERLARGMGTRLQISFKEDGLTDENGWS